MSATTLQPPAAPTYTHAQVKRVITGIMLCILLAAMDQTVVIPAVPAIARDLKAFGHLSWIVSAYLVTSTAATPIIGKLSDSYGRRALLIPSIAVFMLASGLCAMCQTLPELIAARALQGMGGAGLMAMAQAAVADVVAPRERGRYQGYMASMWGLASIAGPVVGGWTTDHLTWRYVFWVNLPLGVLAIVLCDRGLRLLPVRGGRPKMDLLGSLLLVTSITSWLLVLSWGGSEFPWASWPIVGLAALGTALGAALIWQERRAADPVLPPRLFANPTFTRGVCIAFCTSGVMLGSTFLLPLYYQLLHGYAAAGSGVLIMPFLLATVVGAMSGGQLARRLGRTKGIVLTGIGCSLAGAATLALLPATMPELASTACSAVVGLGLGTTLPAVLVQVQNSAGRGDVGAATGSLLFLRSMGGAVGTTMVGALLMLSFGAEASKVDLGNVRERLAAMAPGARADALHALSGGFHTAFGACTALLCLALALSLGMRDEELRSSGEPTAIAH